MQVLGGLGEPGVFSNGGGINDEDDGADVLWVGERGRCKVAQLAVSGGVKQQEAA